jgi:hypothetical protein
MTNGESIQSPAAFRAAPRHAAPPGLITVLLCCCLAACGGSAKSPAATTAGAPASTVAGSPVSSTAAGSTAPADPAAEKAAITAAFTEFFDGKTATPRREQLLQNGPLFAQVLAQQARSGLNSTSSVQVGTVTLHPPSLATAGYTVLLAGKPALANQLGIAVRISGNWLVSAGTFCALLTLEGQAPPACAQPTATALPH